MDKHGVRNPADLLHSVIKYFFAESPMTGKEGSGRGRSGRMAEGTTERLWKLNSLCIPRHIPPSGQNPPSTSLPEEEEG